MVKFSSDYSLIDTLEKFPDNQMLILFSNDCKFNENVRYPVNTNIAYSNIYILLYIQNVYTETFLNIKENRFAYQQSHGLK